MYQWNPKDYAQNSGAQRGWAEDLMERLHLSGDERILDIGCGDGKISAALADHVPDGAVLGIDRSADMIRFAQERHASSTPRLDFEVCDAAALQFENEFDVVFSNAALHWVQDHPSVVQGIARALRPGGRVLLSMGGKGNVAEVIASTQSLAKAPDWAPYFEDAFFTYSFHATEDYQAWLSDEGLEAVRLELVPKDMVHTREKFTAWIRTTWIRHTQRVPEDRRERFISDLVDHYLMRCPPDPEGLVHTRMVRLEVEATKPNPSM